MPSNPTIRSIMRCKSAFERATKRHNMSPPRQRRGVLGPRPTGAASPAQHARTARQPLTHPGIRHDSPPGGEGTDGTGSEGLPVSVTGRLTRMTASPARGGIRNGWTGNVGGQVGQEAGRAKPARSCRNAGRRTIQSMEPSGLMTLRFLKAEVSLPVDLGERAHCRRTRCLGRLRADGPRRLRDRSGRRRCASKHLGAWGRRPQGGRGG